MKKIPSKFFKNDVTLDFEEYFRSQGAELILRDTTVVDKHKVNRLLATWPTNDKNGDMRTIILATFDQTSDRQNFGHEYRYTIELTIGTESFMLGQRTWTNVGTDVKDVVYVRDSLDKNVLLPDYQLELLAGITKGSPERIKKQAARNMWTVTEEERRRRFREIFA